MAAATLAPKARARRSHHLTASLASGQREAFGAENLRLLGLERLMNQARSRQGHLCLLGPAQNTTGIMSRQDRSYGLSKYRNSSKKVRVAMTLSPSSLSLLS